MRLEGRGFFAIAVMLGYEVKLSPSAGLLAPYACSSAWAMSATRSSVPSRPQLMRTMAGEMPAAKSSSSVIWRCVELAGCRQHVRASATCVSIAAIFSAAMKRSAASRPPASSNDTTPHEPFGRYFSANSW